jgi:TetR/AcrR family transcriptional regulator, repressor of fatR-cypB operon
MGDKRTAILQSALELFEEFSYGQTPVPLVAERAGVAAGTIYRYFPGKESLVNEVYQHWKLQFAQALVADLDPQFNAEASFRQIWSQLCDFAVTHTDAFAFLETHHHASYLNEQSLSIGREVDTAMEKVIFEWQLQNQVRNGDPATLLAQVYGGFVGVFRQHRASGIAITSAINMATVDAAWATLSAPEQTSLPNHKQGSP